MRQSVVIGSRFNGPPNSANGGYACGLMGRMLSGAVEASLKAPPPLDKELVAVRVDKNADLFDGDILLGSACETELDLSVPPLPDPLLKGCLATEAPDVAGRFIPFDRCFVCGSERKPGDGLLIHSHRVEGSPLVVADWTLDAGLSDEAGFVDPLYIWSALDCPGYFACAVGEAALLARLTLEVLAPMKAEGTATIIGWDLTPETGKGGRKRRCGTALYSPDGTLVAKAEGLWVTVDAAIIEGNL